MSKTIYPEDKITDHDIKILEELSTYLLGIWSREIEEKRRDRIYDNNALDDFMSEFAIMISDIRNKKNIADHISYVRGPHLTIEVPVRYE